jgi:hypothetical protein
MLVVVMMMMYNQDYVDQMDVDVYDVIHLEMVVENKVVENRLLHLDLLIDRNYLIHLLY